MIDQKLAIITIHDVNPSHSERILKTLDELNTLKINYNLSIVPYYNKKYNLEDFDNFSKSISSTLQSDNNNVELSLHGLYLFVLLLWCKMCNTHCWSLHRM
jgi:hypothetical protein